MNNKDFFLLKVTKDATRMKLNASQTTYTTSKCFNSPLSHIGSLYYWHTISVMEFSKVLIMLNHKIFLTLHIVFVHSELWFLLGLNIWYLSKQIRYHDLWWTFVTDNTAKSFIHTSALLHTNTCPHSLKQKGGSKHAKPSLCEK